MRARTPGFTAIEFLVAVAILGILTAIAVPQFAHLMALAREGSARGELASLRSAVLIYYTTYDLFPTNLSDGLAGPQGFLSQIPAATIPAVKGRDNPGHEEASGVRQGEGSDADDGAEGRVWYFVPGGVGPKDVFVNCTHKDSKGTVWTTY